MEGWGMWKSSLIFIARFGGGGVVSYATPKILIGVGVPLDKWINGFIAELNGPPKFINYDSIYWFLVAVFGVFLISLTYIVPYIFTKIKQKSKQNIIVDAPPPIATAETEQPPVETPKAPRRKIGISSSGGVGNVISGNEVQGFQTGIRLEGEKGSIIFGNAIKGPTKSSDIKSIESDVWLLHAVLYITSRSWKPVEINYRDEERCSAWNDALMKIRQKAFDGSLPICGIEIGEGPLIKLISKKYWEHHDFNLPSFYSNDPKEFHTKEGVFTSDITIYNSLMTSKAKVEELWPVENT